MEQIGPYRVLQEIARGGVAVVYRARDPLGKTVAVKLLEAREREGSRRRFAGEVKALARLRHPHVVEILDHGEHEGAPWLALELVEGESLQDRLRLGPLSVAEAVQVARQLAQALSYVHGCGVLHRDLKPDNVLLRGQSALLTDFGLALDEQDDSPNRLTLSGTFLGTPGYWSPEQAQGATREIGPRSDIYGLGAVLYACLTGEPPIKARSLNEHLEQARFRSVTPPRALRPEVPEWLDALCMRCLEVDPDQRPESAEAVSRELLTAATAAHPAPSAGRARPLLALGLLLGALLVALGLWWRHDPGADERARGDRLQLEFRWRDAHQAYTEAIAKNPADAEAYALRAQVKLFLRDEQGSVADAERAVELGPDLAVAWLRRGISRAKVGRHEEALADLDRALELEPENAAIWANRGGVLERLGRHEEALADLSRSVELDPEDATAWSSRGGVQSKLGREAEALADYTHALVLDPTHVETLYSQGVLFLNTEDHERALVALGRAIEIAPKREELYTARASVWRALGQPDAALSDLSRALEIQPEDVEALVERARLWIALGEDELARIDLDQAIRSDPNSAVAFAERGSLRGREGDPTGGVADLDRALELNPGMRRAHLTRGTLLANAGDYQAALRDLTRAVAEEPKQAGVFSRRAAVYTQLELHDHALADYDRAVQLSGGDATLYLRRSQTLVRLRRLAEALRDCDQALALGPTDDERSYALELRQELRTALGR